MAEPRELEAVCMVVFVFAFTTAAIEVDAVSTAASVFALIAVWLFVIAEPREEDAVVTSD